MSADWPAGAVAVVVAIVIIVAYTRIPLAHSRCKIFDGVAQRRVQETVTEIACRRLPPGPRRVTL